VSTKAVELPAPQQRPTHGHSNRCDEIRVKKAQQWPRPLNSISARERAILNGYQAGVDTSTDARDGVRGRAIKICRQPIRRTPNFGTSSGLVRD